MQFRKLSKTELQNSLHQRCVAFRARNLDAQKLALLGGDWCGTSGHKMSYPRARKTGKRKYEGF